MYIHNLREILDSTWQNREGDSVQGESTTGGNAVSCLGVQDGNGVADVRLVQGFRAKCSGSMRRNRVRYAKGSQLDARTWIAAGKLTRHAY